ncbi:MULTISPECIES: aromatic amino acid ammonia-lyase [unclassified Pseudoalteromonas]|uniref:HAL/PAL/TAL family ammonia-lyase n=1 Tax=unclassified Pseudoalteromonas TaxID=194690 RepID=UPI002097BBE3|nr:aromatic amino acid ammonia-lyase [Pseudoalteromonas sp. XMcav2-N]MCO7190814.1 aromatic amino acid ammonia-lyase [Pseudoalteromonas sp. XMcav2-N]
MENIFDKDLVSKSTSRNSDHLTLEIGGDYELLIDDVGSFVTNPNVDISLNSALEKVIRENREYLDDKIENREDIYGVTTGFGNSASNRISPELAASLQENLIAYHGCGVGDYLPEQICAATLLIRLNCNAKGFSGVSWELLKQMECLLNHRIFPAIPAMGSVGASGDLTPLSYIGAALAGKRHVYYRGEIRPTSEVFAELDITPYRLKPKEGLAIMNGTSVMCGIAVMSFLEIERAIELSCKQVALFVELIDGRASPFHPQVHNLKPHPGQIKCAAMIYERLSNPEQRLGRRLRSDDEFGAGKKEQFRLQDSYSIRCSPQVIGPLLDTLDWAKRVITTEINSVNDNPLFDNQKDLILNAGHFYGGHVAAVCDALKPQLANLAALLERELGILVDDRLNGGIPNNLVAIDDLGDESWINHGFKAVQITASALTAEALKNASPMSVFSRTTEALNQDIVSMGTIAARDLKHILSLVKPVIAIHAMAIRQAFYVLDKDGSADKLNTESMRFFEQLRDYFTPVIQDRPMDRDIDTMVKKLFPEYQLHN